MKTGELTGAGVLFMRTGIYQQRTSADEVQLIFPLLERRGRGVQQVTATWTGREAEEFARAQQSHIKAGTAISFTFSRFFCHSNELHAVVETACLSPDRWQANPAAQNPFPQTETNPQEINA